MISTPAAAARVDSAAREKDKDEGGSRKAEGKTQTPSPSGESASFILLLMKSALILFAHGARDPEWALPFRKIKAAVAARRPGLTVELAFLEFMPPALPDAVEKLATAHDFITIAPLFMAQGGHLKHDIPLILDDLRRRFPAVTLTLLPAVGDVDIILDAISGWLVNSTPR